MKTPWWGVTFIAATLGLAVNGIVISRADVRVSLEKCPGPVRRTLERESHGGKIMEIEKERQQGRTIFEAEVMLDGKEYEIEVQSDGLLLRKVLDEDDEEETDVTLAECPESVRKTIRREAGTGKIEEIERESHGQRNVYEAEVLIDDREYEIVVREDGLLLEKVLDDDEDR